MVVLDGHNMLGTNPNLQNQYLQPDYLSPLPTTLDSKKSPLALLAQTCSAIGADSPNAKSLLPSISESNKRKSSSSSDTSSLNSDQHRPRSSGSGNSSVGGSKSGGGGKTSPAFRPYESLTTKPSSNHHSNSTREESGESKAKRPKTSSSPKENGHSKSSSSSSSSSQPRNSPSSHNIPATSNSTSSVGNSSDSNKEKERSSESNNSSSSNNKEKQNSSSSSSSNHEKEGKSSPKSSTSNHSSIDQGSSPIIRSGLEVLHGHLGGGKDLRDYGKSPGGSLSSLSALAGYPPSSGFDNPALRPSFFPPPGSSLGHHGHFLYPPTGSPYLNYSRVKTGAGGESIVGVCKDPFCSGCQLSTSSLMAAAAAAGFSPFGSSASLGATQICPAGCATCDHQKFSIGSLTPGGGWPGGLPPPPPGLGLSSLSSSAAYSSLLSQHQQQQSQAAAAQRPYVCNWIIGDNYCGKRFVSSEELLTHLRSHTNLSNGAGANSAAETLAAVSQSQAFLNSSATAAIAAMHRNYPTPPLSPLSAARYHPYAAAAAAAGKSQASVNPFHPSLLPYYSSPYLYGPGRIGQVHP